MNNFTDKFKEAKSNGYNLGSCVRVECESKFLLLRRSEFDFGAGILELPGGSIDSCESLESAAARELFEEAGIMTNEVDLAPLDIFEFHNIETGKHKVKFAFSLILNSLPEIKLSEEHSEHVWLTKAEIEALPRQGVHEQFVIWGDHFNVLVK